MKKKLILLLIIIICFICLQPNIKAIESLETIPLTQYSKSAILIESSTKQVIYEKASEEKLSPASMTKIMTMLITMEKIDSGIIHLNDMVQTPKEAAELGGSQIYLSEGEEMSVEDLLKSMAISSANDAALTLAIYIGGSEEVFVKMMNDKVKELNLVNTHFVNPYGFDDNDHYSCSYDMAIIASTLIEEHPKILDYTSRYEDYVREDTLKRFWLVNTNKLVKFMEGVDGLKTGWTQKAGYCLTCTIKRNDNRFIAVAMGCENVDQRTKDITSMLNYGINNYTVDTYLKKGTIVTSKEDLMTSPNHYDIVLAKDIKILKRNHEDNNNITTKIILEDKITSDKVGILEVYVNGNLYQTVPLITNLKIKKAKFLDVFLEILKELFIVSK